MGLPQQRASAPYAREQRDPKWRKAVKRLIERGCPRSLAREAARQSLIKPKVRQERSSGDE